MDTHDNLPVETKNNFISTIERLASDPNVDPIKLEKFMDLQERILDRNAEQAFNADMVLCQSEIKVVHRNQKNTQTNSRYSDLAEIIKAIKPVYTKCGFALSFYEGDTQKENHVRVMVDVMHRGGHSKTRYKDFPIDDRGIKGTTNKTQIHANQSAFMYGRRALTCMVFNVSTGDDDDGNAAGNIDLVTDEQIANINALAKEVGADMIRFLRYIRFDCVENIPAKQYKRVISELEKKRERKRGK